MTPLAIAGLGTPELLIILAVDHPALRRGQAPRARPRQWSRAAHLQGRDQGPDGRRRRPPPRPRSSARSRPGSRPSSTRGRPSSTPSASACVATTTPDRVLGLSIAGVVDLLRGRPHHPVGADGRMALADHLRELRARLIRSALFLVVAFGVALFFYDQLLDLVLDPYNDARGPARRARPRPRRTSPGATGPLMLQLKLCGVAAIVVSSPYWLYQIWALHRARAARQREEVVADLRGASPGPLFILGVADRLLRAAQGPRGADRLHPGRAAEPRRVRRLLQLHDPDAAGLRHRLRDPAVRDHAQPRRRGLRARRWAATGPGSSSAPSSSPRWPRPRPTRSRC